MPSSWLEMSQGEGWGSGKHLPQRQGKQCCQSTVVLALNACGCQMGVEGPENSVGTDCVSFMWIIQYGLSSYVSLIELNFWTRLNVESWITPLGSPRSMKPVCLSRDGVDLVAFHNWHIGGDSCLLRTCFSWCGPWTSSVSIAWELVRNANMWTPTQTHWVQISGGVQQSAFEQPSRRFWCTKIWELLH